MERLSEPDRRAEEAVRRRASKVLRPAGALAQMDDVAAWLASWQRTESPRVKSPAAIVFVADHGVTVEGVSAYPAEVTRSMLGAIEEGVATSSVLADALGATLSVVDVGVGEPTGNIAVEDALSPERFERAWQAGSDAVAELDADILILGEMGIGNTTAAAAVCAGLFGLGAEHWTGLGTGIDAMTLKRKVTAVERAVGRLAPDEGPMEVLRRVGGAELVALAGAATQARLRSIPVILDGFVVTAALAALEVARPGSLDHCIAGHCSSEPGHRVLLDKLGKRPLLDLDLRLGEGSGALFALPLVRLAAASVTEVATFQERDVPGRT
jgi:nicotinate-nucleotide--dimethylbenzimidazole phosphoribosyltransferase